jgi:hypothetical protein
MSMKAEEVAIRDYKLYVCSPEWTESSFNWDTKPELGEKLLDVDTTSDYNKKYFEMDVTEYVKAHMGETITFVLCNEGASSSNNHMDLGSREHAGQEPQLVIE